MPYPADSQDWQLSILAQFLRPVVGERAAADARGLIAQFGSLRRAYSASIDAIGNVSSPAVAMAIVGARRLARAAVLETLVGEPVDVASPSFRAYLVDRLGSRRDEAVLGIFLSAEGLFLAESCKSYGQVSHSAIPVRHIVRRALDTDARRVVIAHNHPSGNCKPSKEDVAATLRLRAVLAALDIVLEDHLIVGGRRVGSLHGMQLI